MNEITANYLQQFEQNLQLYRILTGITWIAFLCIPLFLFLIWREIARVAEETRARNIVLDAKNDTARHRDSRA